MLKYHLTAANMLLIVMQTLLLLSQLMHVVVAMMKRENNNPLVTTMYSHSDYTTTDEQIRLQSRVRNQSQELCYPRQCPCLSWPSFDAVSLPVTHFLACFIFETGTQGPHFHKKKHPSIILGMRDLGDKNGRILVYLFLVFFLSSLDLTSWLRRLSRALQLVMKSPCRLQNKHDV